jgi:hypothetical protein
MEVVEISPWTWQERHGHAAKPDAATGEPPILCRIAHAEGAASRPASIMGFEERQSEPAECGICLDAMEGVAVNGCSHRLCGEVTTDSLCILPLLLWCSCMRGHHLYRLPPSTRGRCACLQWSVRCHCVSSTRSRRCVPSAASRSKAFTWWHDTCWQGTRLCHTEAQGCRMPVLLRIGV